MENKRSNTTTDGAKEWKIKLSFNAEQKAELEALAKELGCTSLGMLFSVAVSVASENKEEIKEAIRLSGMKY